ncbi:hypothetical protein PSTT_04122 [Puccinia striiformis]|uniref:Isochorismatase-like domain-containing protein n=1 Tax=Puccinia striiformis TaxID=27350 RepID=A0A2S4VTS9_9BASI|nr:hypothetical protein PSTT_04122 [Puccinia striiformis]
MINQLKTIKPNNTIILLCDMQERFRTKINHFEHVEKMAGKLLKAATTLEIPILATEQYPKALGGTVKSLMDLIPSSIVPRTETDTDKRVYPKTSFSMYEVLKSNPHYSNNLVQMSLWSGSKLILYTSNFVLADAVSSCNPQERSVALQSIRDAGGNITTTESFIYRLLSDANHPKSKEIFAIVKEYSPDTKSALEALC